MIYTDFINTPNPNFYFHPWFAVCPLEYGPTAMGAN